MNKNPSNITSLGLAGVLFLAIFSPVRAEINEAFTYQGKVVSETGTNLTSADAGCVNEAGADSCDFKISIYTEATNGTLVWRETKTDVEISENNGIFNFKLDCGGNFSDCNRNGGPDFANGKLYIEVEFDPSGDGDFSENEVFSPRRELTAVPYAFNAKEADKINGLEIDSFLRTDEDSTVAIGNLLTVAGDLDISGNLTVADEEINFSGATTNLLTNGNFSINNNSFFVNKNNGFVGIGTTMPTEKLTVNGNIQVKAGNDICIENGNCLSDISGGGGGGNSLWEESSYGNNIYREEGMIGVGTKYPWAKMHIKNENSSWPIPGLYIEGVSGNQGHHILWKNYGGNYGGITWDGKLGIGTISPNRQLFVNGDAGGTTGWYNDSDRRFKKDIVSVENALDKIVQLGGVYYYWDKEAFPERAYDDNKHLGFIAQDLQKIVPEVVYEGDDGYLSVEYSALTPLLSTAIKEQQEQIGEQKMQLETLTEKTEDLSWQTSDKIKDVKKQLIKQGKDITALSEELEEQIEDDENRDELIVKLDKQIEELKENDVDFPELMKGKIVDNENDIKYLEKVLGVDDAKETDDLNIAGEMKVDKIIVDEITAQKMAIKNEEGKETMGSAIILTGEKSVIVKTKAVDDESKIHLTPLSSTFGEVPYVGKIKIGESFKIKIDKAVAEDIKINWWLVGMEK